MQDFEEKHGAVFRQLEASFDDAVRRLDHQEMFWLSTKSAKLLLTASQKYDAMIQKQNLDPTKTS